MSFIQTNFIKKVNHRGREPEPPPERASSDQSFNSDLPLRMDQINQWSKIWVMTLFINHTQRMGHCSGPAVWGNQIIRNNQSTLRICELRSSVAVVPTAFSLAVLGIKRLLRHKKEPLVLGWNSGVPISADLCQLTARKIPRDRLVADTQSKYRILSEDAVLWR